MKICACIAEYNPLHNGHIKQIEYMRNELKAEKILIIMSGNFTQRGEPAILNKFTRAKQAILAGADIVIELPTVFATSNAETFAKGAIQLIESLGVVDGLCFGVENGNSNDYLELAKILNNETKNFKKVLKDKLDLGLSLAKAKLETVKELGIKFNEDLLSKPNNILGIEYTKALLNQDSRIQIYPMLRIGEANHNDTKLYKGITSATSIREQIKQNKIKRIKKNVPSFVYKDIKFSVNEFDKLIMSSTILSSSNEIASVADCTEGLENRIKALVKDNRNLDNLVNKISTKRYTLARVRRILLNNFLRIDGVFVNECINAPLYAKILAVKKESKGLITLISKSSNIPLLTRKSDANELKRIAKKCFEKDIMVNDIYNNVLNEQNNEHLMLII